MVLDVRLIVLPTQTGELELILGATVLMTSM